MANNHTTVQVSTIPNCDLCAQDGREVPAVYDAKLNIGPWANVCEQHFDDYGCHVGLGWGQEFILRTD